MHSFDASEKEMPCINNALFFPVQCVLNDTFNVAEREKKSAIRSVGQARVGNEKDIFSPL